MKYFKLTFTEINGEQEYTYNYLLKAKDRLKAESAALKFLSGWYDDDEAEVTWPDNVEFFCGCIIVNDISIEETTVEQFTQDLIQRYTV